MQVFVAGHYDKSQAAPAALLCLASEVQEKDRPVSKRQFGDGKCPPDGKHKEREIDNPVMTRKYIYKT